MGEVIKFSNGSGKNEDDIYFEMLRRKRAGLSDEERQEWRNREEASRNRHPSASNPDQDQDLLKGSSSDRIEPDDQ